MEERRTCPGCGLAAPAPEAPTGAPPAGSSDGCWAAFLEVAAFEADRPALQVDHQLLVDAYGAQHAPAGSIRLPYSLVGLLLALEEGWPGPAVRALHGRMGKPQADWPVLGRPVSTGARTILDVADAGARRTSEPGHRRALHLWAAVVWSSYADQHEQVRSLTARFR